MTSGLQAGDLIIIAGRPSMGKSTLAVNIAENAALGSNKSARHLQHGNVRGIADLAHDLVARPHHQTTCAPAGCKKRIGRASIRHDAVEQRQDLHSTKHPDSRRRSYAHAAPLEARAGSI